LAGFSRTGDARGISAARIAGLIGHLPLPRYESNSNNKISRDLRVERRVVGGKLFTDGQYTMKTHILFRHTSLAGLLALTLLLAKMGAPAQEQVTNPRQERSEPSEAVSSMKFDIGVSAGHIVEDHSKQEGRKATVANLVEYMQKKDPNVNFILRAGVGEVPLEDFKLHSVNIMTILSALPELTGQKVGVSRTIGNSPGVGGGGLFGGGGRGGRFGGVGDLTGGGVVVLEPISQENRLSMGTMRQVQVFNVNGSLAALAQRGKGGQKDIDEWLSQVKLIVLDTLQRLKMRPLSSQETPDFQFHPGTGLLILVGTPEALGVAGQVINELPTQSSGASNLQGPELSKDAKQKTREDQATLPAAGTNH